MAYRTLQLLRSQFLLCLFCTFFHSLLVLLFRTSTSISPGPRPIFFQQTPVSILGNLHLYSGHRQLPSAVGVILASVLQCGHLPLVLGQKSELLLRSSSALLGPLSILLRPSSSCRLTSSGTFSSHCQVTLLAHVNFPFGPKSGLF